MRVGVSTASLFNRAQTEDAISILNDLGVKHAEVFLGTYYEYERAFAELLLERKGDVLINSVHVLNTQYEPQLFNKNERVRADAFGYFEKALQAAALLGAPYYTMHGGVRAKRASRDGRFDDVTKMARNFEKILAFAKERGVQVCLENVEWATCNRPQLFSSLAKDLPNLQGVLDVKQARISGYPYEDYVKAMAGRIAYVHVSDYKNGKMCLPGRGAFDFDTFIKRLRDTGFDGALIVEAYENDYQKVEELKESCDYLSEIAYKNGCLSH